MNAVSLKFYIQTQAVCAEIEAMKATNQERMILGQSLGYTERDFAAKASQLENLHNSLHSAWQDGHAE